MRDARSAARRLSADAGEEGGGGLIGGVLGDELAGEGALEDGLAEVGAAGEVLADGAIEGVEDGEAALDFGGNAGLFRKGRKRKLLDVSSEVRIKNARPSSFNAAI